MKPEEKERRRRLTDLYTTGKEVAFGDDSDEEPIVVYLRKLNPIDQETALRRANAERSKVLSLKSNMEDSAYQQLVEQANGMSVDERIDILIAEDMMKYRGARESEIAAEEEWSNDRYLEGLFESWEDGLKDRYAADPEDPEAKRCFEEMKRYQKIVDDLVDGEQASMVQAYHQMDVGTVLDQTVDKLLSYQSDTKWITEYRRCEIWLSVRCQEDHKQRYFESRDEVDELQTPVIQRLIAEYQALTVPVVEGKDSQVIPSSSESSEEQKPEEISEDSGLTVSPA